MSYGKAFFAKLFCASKKATVSRAFAKRAPFLLLLSGTKEVNLKSSTSLKFILQLKKYEKHNTKEQSPMEKSLQLVFKNAAGSSKIITISNPKENLTKAETDAAMQKIVAANVFNTLGGDLVQAVEARVVNRNVQVLA